LEGEYYRDSGWYGKFATCRASGPASRNHTGDDEGRESVGVSETPTADSGEDPTRADALPDSDVPTRAAADDHSDDSRLLILGRYRLRKQLGSGAFGTVWSARDERLERDVALKMLPRERVVPARFEREARAAARLQHPAIVTLYEAAVDDEGAYLVSELVRGKTLDRLLRDGKLSDREILDVVVSLCGALEHAHAQGVIHRDVKPSNVLVLSRATTPEHPAKLTDFGVAHVVGGETLTRTGDVIGTLAYMAPEQARGRRGVGRLGPDSDAATPAADLYSLAVVTYEALTGVNPLATRGGHRPQGSHVPPVRRQRRDLPRPLGAALDRALSPRPADRGTIVDLRAAVAESLPEAGERRGVVAPRWRDPARVAPRWRDPVDPPRRRERDVAVELKPPRTGLSSQPAVYRAAPPAGAPTPAWLERAVLATATGLSVGWLSAHLHHTHSPLAPVTIALVAALATLLLQNLGGILRLLMLVTALPVGAVILGPLGLAGAWPALVGRTVEGWVRRAIIAGGGLLWLAEAGALTGRDLYWRAGPLDTAIRRGSLAAALVWAAAAALTPVLISARRPRLGLVVAVVGSATVVAGVQALGARPLRDAALGAALGGAIAAWPSLRALGGQLRRDAGIGAPGVTLATRWSPKSGPQGGSGRRPGH